MQEIGAVTDLRAYLLGQETVSPTDLLANLQGGYIVYRHSETF